MTQDDALKVMAVWLENFTILSGPKNLRFFQESKNMLIEAKLLKRGVFSSVTEENLVKLKAKINSETDITTQIVSFLYHTNYMGDGTIEDIKKHLDRMIEESEKKEDNIL